MCIWKTIKVSVFKYFNFNAFFQLKQLRDLSLDFVLEQKPLKRLIDSEFFGWINFCFDADC